MSEIVTAEAPDLVLTVVHEAGHAVVAMHVGFTVLNITTFPDDTGALGSATYAPTLPNPYPSKRACAAAALAGFIACMDFGFGTEQSLAGCRGDFDTVRLLGFDPYDETLWDDTLAVLRANRDMQQALQEALAARRCLDRDEVAAIRDQVIAARRELAVA